MNEEQINQIKDQIRNLMREISSMGEEPPEFIQDLLLQVIEKSKKKIQALRQQTVLPQQAPSDETKLLWILSGNNPESFVSYLQTYPGDSFQSLLRNPDRLQHVVAQLQKTNPIESIPQQQQDGIEKSGLQSSNIYGANYDPKSGKLRVRFQEGNVYEYDNVPPYVFNAFRNGASAAKTSGSNRFGKWWVGKSPSLGAAFWNYIRQAGYAYRKLK